MNDRLAELERVRPGLRPGDPDARQAITSSHVFDLSAHEQRRLSAVLAATPDLDPGAVLAAEVEAHRMLYSGLDADQQAVLRMLVDAGVLDA